MTPNKKLDWFRARNWSEEKIASIKHLVVSRWEESYKKLSKSAPSIATPSNSGPAPHASVSV
jgi:hypothetical protein